MRTYPYDIVVSDLADLLICVLRSYAGIITRRYYQQYPYRLGQSVFYLKLLTLTAISLKVQFRLALFTLSVNIIKYV